MIKIESKLIDACKEQDRLAQNQLYKELFSFLMNICIRYKNDYDTAGESLNLIFLKVLTKLDHFQSKDSFVPWVKRIAVNHLIDEYRKHKREKQHVQYIEETSNQPDIGERHLGEEKLDSEYLLIMIRELPEATAQVFNMYVIDGYKHREIADILKMSENTSKWHLREARIKLQEKLKIYNENSVL